MNTTDNFTTVEENSTTSFSHSTLSQASHQVIGILLYSVAFVAFITNMVVVCVFLKNKKLHTPENVFIISVAVGGILQSCVIPSTATASISEEWRTEQNRCTITAFVTFFIGMASIYNITAMSIQRYLIITKPGHPSLKNLKPTMIALVASWLAGLLWAVTPLTGIHSYGFEGINVSCGLEWDRNDTGAQIFIILLFVSGFFFPAGIIILSYTAICIKVTPTCSSRLGVVRSSIERKTGVVKVALCVTCSFFVAWTPYAIISIWKAFGNGEDIQGLSNIVPALIAKCSCVFNPIVYAGTHTQFRKAFIEMLPCKIVGYGSERRAEGIELRTTTTSRSTNSTGSHRIVQLETKLVRSMPFENTSPAPVTDV